MAVYPRIWNRTVPLVQNVPVVLDPQFDGGFIPTYWEIYAMGKEVEATILGSTWLIPSGVGLKFPGPIASVSVVCTDVAGSGVYALASEDQGQLPSLDVTAAAGGGGGGGGSGAPASAPYVIDSASIPLGFTGAVLPLGAMTHALQPTLLAQGAPLDSILLPLDVVADFQGGNTTPGGGVGVEFHTIEGTGAHEFGKIQFAKTASGVSTKVQVTGLIGAPMLEFDPTSGSGLSLYSAGGADVHATAAGFANLVLESAAGNVRIKTNGNEIVQFTTGHMDSVAGKDLTIGAAAGKSLTILNGGQTAGVGTSDDVTTPVYVQTAGGQWGFRTDGKMSVPASAGFIGSNIVVDSTGIATFKGSGTTTLQSTGGVTQIYGQTNVTLGSNGTLGASAVTSATFSGETTTKIGSTTSSGDTTLQVGGAKSAILQNTSGNLILSTAVVTGLADGVNPSDSVNFSQLGGLHDLFTSGQVSITGGSGTQGVAVGSAYNGKQAVVTLQSAGGAICTTPCIFQAAVSGGTLTVNMIDAVLGTPVVATTNLVLAYIICAY